MELLSSSGEFLSLPSCTNEHLVPWEASVVPLHCRAGGLGEAISRTWQRGAFSQCWKCSAKRFVMLTEAPQPAGAHPGPGRAHQPCCPCQGLWGLKELGGSGKCARKCLHQCIGCSVNLSMERATWASSGMCCWIELLLQGLLVKVSFRLYLSCGEHLCFVTAEVTRCC